MQFTRFLNRVTRYLDTNTVADFLTEMRATYFGAYPFNEQSRVIYFFPQEKVLAVGGQEDSILAGLATKNGVFETISSVGNPTNGEVIQLNVGNKVCEAVLYNENGVFGSLIMEFTTSNYSNKADFEAYIKPKLSTGNATTINSFATEGNSVAFNLGANASFVANAFGEDVELVQVIDYNGQIDNVGEGCFWGCTNLTGTLLPNLTEIPDNCYNSCPNFVNMGFGTITSVGVGAFRDCIALQDNEWFDTVETLGESAFEGCNTLESISFSNATTIGTSCFKNCGGLASVDFNSLSIISANAFEGCTVLETANIANATNTAHSCFKNCYLLDTVNMPNIQSVADSAFENCIALININFQSALTTGARSFMGCTSLETVALINATSIGNSTFENCSACTNINILSATVIGNNTNNNRVFQGCSFSGLTITIHSTAQSDKDITDAASDGATIIID